MKAVNMLQKLSLNKNPTLSVEEVFHSTIMDNSIFCRWYYAKTTWR